MREIYGVVRVARVGGSGGREGWRRAPKGQYCVDTDCAEHLSVPPTVGGYFVWWLCVGKTPNVWLALNSPRGHLACRVRSNLALHQGLANKAVMGGGRALTCLYLTF